MPRDYVCPAAEFGLSDDRNGRYAMRNVYGMNLQADSGQQLVAGGNATTKARFIGHPYDFSGYHEMEVTKPSEAMMAGDAVNSYLTKQHSNGWVDELNSQNNAVALRHPGTTGNYLHFDAHAANVAEVDLAVTGSTPSDFWDVTNNFGRNPPPP
jgi:prepilin-type processing-associated H-X9-DG protein